MGRKMRNGALLMLVLVIIYTQQAVIYAQNESESVAAKTTETENDGEQDKSGGEEGDKEEPEKPGGEGDKEEPEKPGGEGDKEEPEEPEKPEIRKYNMEIPKADGKNGYYLSKPSIKIAHNGYYGTTVYELKHGEEIFSEGRWRRKER